MGKSGKSRRSTPKGPKGADRKTTLADDIDADLLAHQRPQGLAEFGEFSTGSASLKFTDRDRKLARDVLEEADASAFVKGREKEDERLAAALEQEGSDDVPECFKSLTDEVYNHNSSLLYQMADSSDNEVGEDEETARSEKEAKICEQFAELAKVMTIYKSTHVSLPKGMKIVYKLNRWSKYLRATNPDRWSPHAMYEMVKFFSHGATDRVVTKFYSEFLLPALLKAISKKGRLHMSHYNALIRTVWRPGPFIDGIIIPIATSPHSTYKQALVIGSALAKMKIPTINIQFAIHKLTSKLRRSPQQGEDQWLPVTSLFHYFLLNKNKQGIPSKVIDSYFEFAASFLVENERPPLIWYQPLISICERYPQMMGPRHKEVVSRIIKTWRHDVNHSVLTALAR